MGWGHSSIRDAILFAKMCQVKKLSVFHHEPTRTDEQVYRLLQEVLQQGDLNFELEMCAEGNTYEL